MIEEQTMRELPGIVKDNITCLKQGEDLITHMNRDQYSTKVGHCFNSSAGEHFRHIIDHYESLMNGAAVGQEDVLRIDYDSRRRDREVELNPEAGIARLQLICSFLEQLDVDAEIGLEVKMDTGSDITDQWAPSTLLRELQFLLSHTVHHYALIATMNAINGIGTPEEFGIAPSTLAYRRQLSA